jgi:hypothetical protein
MAIYLGGFADTEVKYPVLKNEGDGHWDGFEVNEILAEEIKTLDIIVAAYNVESYSGDAFVLYRKDGKLYEVNDSHCSCYGLGNWEPDETTKEALLLRFSDYPYGVFDVYKNELKSIIEAL